MGKVRHLTIMNKLILYSPWVFADYIFCLIFEAFLMLKIGPSAMITLNPWLDVKHFSLLKIIVNKVSCSSKQFNKKISYLWFFSLQRIMALGCNILVVNPSYNQFSSSLWNTPKWWRIYFGMTVFLANEFEIIFKMKLNMSK